MNALRHVTYRDRKPWISEDDLVLTKTLADRISYVRTNLIDDTGQSMTQSVFAESAGLVKDHHGVRRWEKGESEPKPRARERIAALAKGANYRPEVFSRRGAEARVVEFAVPRLRSLGRQADETRGILRVVLKALDEHGIQVPLDEAAVGFLATPASANPGTP